VVIKIVFLGGKRDIDRYTVYCFLNKRNKIGGMLVPTIKNVFLSGLKNVSKIKLNINSEQLNNYKFILVTTIVTLWYLK